MDSEIGPPTTYTSMTVPRKSKHASAVRKPPAPPPRKSSAPIVSGGMFHTESR